MSVAMKTLITILVTLILVASTALWAHEMTVRGTVAGIERSRIQVKTGEERKGVAPTWYAFTATTKISRGKKILTYDDARIVVGERVVLNVDHASDGKMTTLEIRLAE